MQQPNHTIAPANDNTPRPAEFDARVLQWMPFLHKLAYRFERNAQDREDLINETVEVALRRWASYRYEGSFSAWLSFQMRERVADIRRRSRRHIAEPLEHITETTNLDGEPYAARSTHATEDANHDNIVELDQVRAALKPGRVADMVMRIAAGEEYSAVAARYGVSRQRAHQIVTAERTRLRKALNTVRVAA